MAPKYILNYLHVPARGELIRVIFHQADVEFEDKKYKFSQVPEMKADGKYPLILRYQSYCLRSLLFESGFYCPYIIER